MVVEETRDEPVLAVVPDFDPVVEDQPSISVELEPEPLRVREDDRASAVLDAADDQAPALEDPAGSRAGQFIAMAAGVVVALALGAVAFMYGASGLGIDFGGGDAKTTAGSAPAPTTTPVAVVNQDDLKAARQQIEELQARLERLEAEKTAAAAARPRRRLRLRPHLHPSPTTLQPFRPRRLRRRPKPRPPHRQARPLPLRPRATPRRRRPRVPSRRPGRPGCPEAAFAGNRARRTDACTNSGTASGTLGAAAVLSDAAEL